MSRPLRTLAALAATLALGSALPAAAQLSPASPSAIKILGCIVTKPKPFSHRASGTEIAYVNTGPTVLHVVTFEVGYQTAAAEYKRSVEDDGTFAPNTPVRHHFATYSDVLFAGTTTTSCKAIAVR